MRWPILSAAPHRLFFIGGLSMMIISMVVWMAARASLLAAPLSGLDHAFLISHGVLAFFVFGFLITVFPRWLDQPAIKRSWYLSAFLGMAGGVLGLLIGLGMAPPLVPWALGLAGAGWLVGWLALARVFWDAQKTVVHTLVVLPALLLGLGALLAYAFWRAGGEWTWVYVGVTASLWLFLAPVFLSVSHRMIPFFTHAALGGNYEMARPTVLLWLLVAGCWAHFGLGALHCFEWLWLADLPLAAIAGYLWLRWQPGRSHGNALLRALFVAFAWFPIATLIAAAQSLWYLIDGNFLFGRAPVHALTIGFFSTMAMAMVTRVALGHSGRKLFMQRWQWRALLMLQGVALVRIAAEWPGLTADIANTLISVSSWLWLITLSPWAGYFIWICATPRIDGKDG
ncbi:MAG: NnrS family protein [Gammaproteobacteria bacterium]